MTRKSHSWPMISMAAALVLAGCGGGSSKTAHAIGDPAIQAADVVARSGTFHQPLDAAPSPDGSVIYFAATGDHGPALYSVAAAGGAIATIAEGAPLTRPTGVAVAIDGTQVFVADQRAQGTGASRGLGAILTPAAKGTPHGLTAVPGTQGRSPRGLDVGADVITFTGTDPANETPGLFQVPVTGGTVQTIAEGAPFIVPDSVVVTAQGVAYVTDQGPNPGQGMVFRVNGSTVTPVLTGLHLGTPAGLTLINNDATLLVSSIDKATLSDQVLFLDLATGKTAAATKVIGANKNSSGGLHRAHNAAVLGWADIQGQVYRVRYPIGPGLT